MSFILKPPNLQITGVRETSASYLIPWTEDPSRKHKKVSHGNQAGPYDQGENA